MDNGPEPDSYDLFFQDWGKQNYTDRNPSHSLCKVDS